MVSDNFLDQLIGHRLDEVRNGGRWHPQAVDRVAHGEGRFASSACNRSTSSRRALTSASACRLATRRASSSILATAQLLRLRPACPDEDFIRQERMPYLATTKTVGRRTGMRRAARPPWRRSPRAGGGSGRDENVRVEAVIPNNSLAESNKSDSPVQLAKATSQRVLPAWFKDEKQWWWEAWWKGEDERKSWCLADQTFLNYGRWKIDPFVSRLQYVTVNGAVMLATLVVTFLALTAAMAAVRKWWRWLW